MHPVVHRLVSIKVNVSRRNWLTGEASVVFSSTNCGGKMSVCKESINTKLSFYLYTLLVCVWTCLINVMRGAWCVVL